jgi:hypothetical protein
VSGFHRLGLNHHGSQCYFGEFVEGDSEWFKPKFSSERAKCVFIAVLNDASMPTEKLRSEWRPNSSGPVERSPGVPKFVSEVGKHIRISKIGLTIAENKSGV